MRLTPTEPPRPEPVATALAERERQGLPPVVTDPATLAQVVRIFRAASRPQGVAA